MAEANNMDAEAAAYDLRIAVKRADKHYQDAVGLAAASYIREIDQALVSWIEVIDRLQGVVK